MSGAQTVKLTLARRESESLAYPSGYSARYLPAEIFSDVEFFLASRVSASVSKLFVSMSRLCWAAVMLTPGGSFDDR